ncbi:MAG: hypothetical protein Unbinned4098contig1000_27 [Prokaryotic dsDNA virus sp.]|nr:MAG: hypothetical protein Unbinned4098contig1000_27 [Prokaryotic dsDNA virus sp.]|tara:strand:- start:6054 stop:6671 length:618 start_codon:yes stop_codon:yes gene_type:complete
MTYPTDLPPITPELHDGLDSLTGLDLQFVESNISGLQTTAGTRDSTQTIPMGEYIKQNCRIATGQETGNFPATTSGDVSVTVNGNTWTYNHPNVLGSSTNFITRYSKHYFKGLKIYFQTDKGDDLFTEPPIVFIKPNKPFAGSVSASYITEVSIIKSTRNYFIPMSNQIGSSGTTIYYDFSWLAIQPIGGAIDLTTEYRDSWDEV